MIIEGVTSMSPEINRKANYIQPKVGVKARFIPVANCSCVHCGVNMSGFKTVFIVMDVRGQQLLLTLSGTTVREWLTDGQVAVLSDHLKQVG